MTSELWQAHFQDEQHDVDCIIENHYDENRTEQSLRMCINGVTFWGTDFDDWTLSESGTEAERCDIKKQFTLLKYGSPKTGYGYWLQSYLLQVKIPVFVFSLTKQCEIAAELDILFSNKPQEKQGVIDKSDGEKVSNITDCERFALIVEDHCYEAESPCTFFDIPLQSICKQIAGIYYLCNCFGCLYSDYSPYGQGNIGSLCCFVDNKEVYLKVYSKYEGEYTIWHAFAGDYVQCQETAVCQQFAPRVNCLGGYRGNIYE